jgi:hypothetical protein
MKKIAYSKDPSFRLFTQYSSSAGLISIGWSAKKDVQIEKHIQITEDFVRQYLNAKEISEATNIYILVDSKGQFQGFKSKMVESYLTKESGFEFANKNGYLIAGQIYVPFSDTKFEDWGIRLNFNAEQDVPDDFVNSEFVETSVKSFHDFTYKQFPSLKTVDVASIDGGKKITVQLTKQGIPVKKGGVRVFAKTSSGYLPNTEAYTDEDGIAKFKALPLGLDSGESMTVEFGFKWVTNLERTEVVA